MSGHVNRDGASADSTTSDVSAKAGVGLIQTQHRSRNREAREPNPRNLSSVGGVDSAGYLGAGLVDNDIGIVEVVVNDDPGQGIRPGHNRTSVTPVSNFAQPSFAAKEIEPKLSQPPGALPTQKQIL